MGVFSVHIYQGKGGRQNTTYDRQRGASSLDTIVNMCDTQGGVDSTEGRGPEYVGITGRVGNRDISSG